MCPKKTNAPFHGLFFIFEALLQPVHVQPTEFLQWTQNKKSVSKVVEYQNVVIAYYHLLLDPELILSFYSSQALNVEKSSYLAQISIHQDYQNQGLGNIIMSDVYAQSSHYNKEDVLLEVNSKTNAFDFYKHQHFQELEAQVFMKKTLNQG